MTSVFHVFQGTEDPDAPPLVLRCFAPEAARTALPDFAALVDLWLERRGAAAVPDWADFDFADFRGWHERITLGSFDTPEPDPTLRLVGESFVEAFGSSAKGLRISEVAPLLYERQLRDHFRSIRQEGLIGLTCGQTPFVGRRHVPMRILELPLRYGGAEVQRTLHVLAPRPPLDK